VPRRRNESPPLKAARQVRGSFHQRYDQLEARRDELVARLAALGEESRRHASYNNALKLLNTTFRKASLAQRAAVLQAASWTIEVLERLTPML
jgi:hypothetical protein